MEQPNIFDEEENDPEYVQDLTELKDIDQTFANNITKCKHILYNIFVTNIPDNNPIVQTPLPLKTYQNKIGTMYKILIDSNLEYIESIDYSQGLWNEIPGEIQDIFSEIVKFYVSFLRKNQGEDERIPYRDYINKSLKIFPYVQRPNFDDYE